MSATLTRTRCTLREFLEIIDDMERSGTYQWMELIGGALVVNSSPSNPHMKAEMPIFALLWAAEEAGYGQAGADRSRPSIIPSVAWRPKMSSSRSPFS